jgi:hypothetical protein
MHRNLGIGAYRSRHANFPDGPANQRFSHLAGKCNTRVIVRPAIERLLASGAMNIESNGHAKRGTARRRASLMAIPHRVRAMCPVCGRGGAKLPEN